MRRRKKRILVDATGIVNKKTGLGKYCYYLLKALVRNNQYRFSVLHQASLARDHPLYELRNLIDNLISVDLPVIGIKRELKVLLMGRLMSQFDLYHCMSSYLPGFGIRIPTIVTIHDLKYALHPEFLGNRMKSLYYRWVIRRGIKRAACVIAVSESTKRDIRNIAISSSKVRVVYEAPTIALHVNDERLPSQVRGKRFFLYVGENRPHKNIARIIDAYRLLVGRLGKRIPLLAFAGTGFSRLNREHKGSGLVFLGAVSDGVLVALYKQSLALVYPSLYEGFGLPLVEAMALGTPVITSNCSSMPEVAGNAALLINPYDVEQIAAAMKRIVLSGKLRYKMRTMGLKRVGDFSWTKAAREVCELYGQIIS